MASYSMSHWKIFIFYPRRWYWKQDMEERDSGDLHIDCGVFGKFI